MILLLSLPSTGIPPCLTSKLVLGMEILLTTLRVRGLHVTKQDKKDFIWLSINLV